MSGPSVVVERAPDGWTHIGGPGMHLLIGLDEDDDRTLTASDAADGGDIDDVIEVLTTGGMRKAHHFVGVHWLPRTRIVAFGPVAAVVTLADGSEHEVRARSAKVWTDLELDEHPEQVTLRVLDEAERNEPAPAPTLTAAGAVAPATTPATDGTPDAEPDSAPVAEPAEPTEPTEPTGDPEPAAEPVEEAPAVPDEPAQEPDEPEARPAAVPTFGAAPAPAGDAEPARPESPWGRSWARPAEPQPEPVATEAPEPVAPPAPSPVEQPEPVAEAPRLRSWGSVTPTVPVRTTAPAAPAAPASAPAPAPAPAPAAAPVPPADFESTWAARPVPEDVPAAAPAPAPTSAPMPAPTPEPAPAADEHDDDVPAAPSYDYLFGHTVAVDEHRKVLAQLTTTAEDDDEHHDDHDEHPAPAQQAPAAPAAPVEPPQPAAPAPAAPAQTPAAPAPGSGGLISSVPWSTGPVPTTGGAPSTPQSAPPAAPAFTGRHTPPPAPSLLPPQHTPRPGTLPQPPAPAPTRAPTQTPTQTPGVPVQPASSASATTDPLHREPTAALPTSTAPLPSDLPGHDPAASAERSFTVPITMPPALSQPAPPSLPVQPAPRPFPVAPAFDGDLGDLDDDVEATVDRSALLEARNAARAAAISGPSVLAVLCGSGHPTPPHSDRCRVCGSGIPPQEPFTMPRPPLGVLRLSTGDVVTLDRSVLLGRSPKVGEGVTATDRPHVVKVPSPERDISRNHVEVLLEGWHVLVRDLGTTNGTTVSLPGEQPVRLRANDQQVLEPGSLVSMADEVSFTFEAGA